MCSCFISSPKPDPRLPKALGFHCRTVRGLLRLDLKIASQVRQRDGLARKSLATWVWALEPTQKAGCVAELVTPASPRHTGMWGQSCAHFGAAAEKRGILPQKQGEGRGLHLANRPLDFYVQPVALECFYSHTYKIHRQINLKAMRLILKDLEKSLGLKLFYMAKDRTDWHWVE